MELLEETTTSTLEAPPGMLVEGGINFFALQSDLVGEVLVRTKHLPEQLIARYLSEALKATHLKKLDDGTWFAEIPAFNGVWAADHDLAKCVGQLREVLLDWLVIKIEQNDRDIPVIADIRLNAI